MSTCSAQQPKPVEMPPVAETRREFQIQLEPPAAERVFRAESEEALKERIRQEFRQRSERAEFPAEVQLAPPGQFKAPRIWPEQVTMVVPYSVCYNPLYFEDKNTERYGWDACIFQPFLSTGKFYLDLAMLPYNMGVNPPHAYECNTGYNLPGDAVPYMLYLPPVSVTGAALEYAVIAGGILIFP